MSTDTCTHTGAKTQTNADAHTGAHTQMQVIDTCTHPQVHTQPNEGSPTDEHTKMQEHTHRSTPILGMGMQSAEF